MESVPAHDDRGQFAAYTLPLAVFFGALAIVALLKKMGGGFWLASPEYWVYPLQTLVCGILLWWFRRRYTLQRPRGLGLTVAVAVVVFVLWIAPQAFLGFTPRLEGFDPGVFAQQPGAYWLTVFLRFVRLVLPGQIGQIAGSQGGLKPLLEEVHREILRRL